jgi:hypothetical protein
VASARRAASAGFVLLNGVGKVARYARETVLRLGSILGRHPIARHVRDLGPLPDRITIVALDLPSGARHGLDRRCQLAAHVGTDGVADALAVQPAQQRLLVQRAVAAQPHLVDTGRQGRQRLLDEASIAGACRHVAVAELVGQDHVLLGPQHHHRPKAGAPVVGRQCRPLVALQNGRIDVEGRHRRGSPLLEKVNPSTIGLRQSLEPLAFASDVTPLTLPERWCRLVEPVQEVARRRRRRQAVTQQQRRRRVLAQWRQVLAALAARSPKAEQPLRQLRGCEPALALLDDDAGVHHHGRAAGAERLDQQRHPAMGGERRRLHPLIQLERQPRLRHPAVLPGRTRPVKP